MRDLKLYLGNWYLWLSGWPQAIRWAWEKGGVSGWWQLIWLYGVDYGLNTATGGDPRVSLSLRFQRDRRQNKLARALRWVANMLFHPGGVDELEVGDDTADNRELSGPGQAVATLATLTLLIYLLIWSYR